MRRKSMRGNRCNLQDPAGMQHVGPHECNVREFTRRKGAQAFGPNVNLNKSFRSLLLLTQTVTGGTFLTYYLITDQTT